MYGRMFFLTTLVTYVVFIFLFLLLYFQFGGRLQQQQQQQLVGFNTKNCKNGNDGIIWCVPGRPVEEVVKEPWTWSIQVIGSLVRNDIAYLLYNNITSYVTFRSLVIIE